ncbi:RNA polymerase factor sigma-54 [Bacteroidetes bacterium endosymbiont of Geopemphigus sp.]|uniref:RNA polymerase factor sigma-54 n=1 Tax=Bacteroidetes bacterium endosymbiont of Geopemphigus sp. TaxID=2047937 RepID=UPI000CCFE6BA|nr:RNA polymerase factor sigma-54 [Bacteroidetes bacterium endosymbiont of Geopemphigus sp.]
MLKQRLQQKLQHKLSPQQIQLMKLIQLPTLAFEEHIDREFEENPALEPGHNEESEPTNEDIAPFDECEGDQIIDTSDINIDEYLGDDEVPDYKTRMNHQGADWQEQTFSAISTESFFDHLRGQLHTFQLGEEDLAIVDFILGNLDDDGYLRRSLENLSDDMAFTVGLHVDVNKIEHLLLHVVQKLYPYGVGARNLRECLLIQLENKPLSSVIVLAKHLLIEAFDLFLKKHYEKIQERFQISAEEFRVILHQIERLNPKPGKIYEGGQFSTEQVIPDFVLRIVEGQLEISLNTRNAPELRVAPSYADMLRSYQEGARTSHQKNAVLFIKQKLDAAKWFIDAVKQREHTLLLTMNAIVDYQRAYFLSGDEQKMHPMVLKDIAIYTGMDISTISRVVSSKYIETPYGTFLIKDFFSEGMTNEEGEEVSTIEIKKILADLISKEGKKSPLSDEKLALLLRKKGYSIARRTVAKYREQLHIPVARLRRHLQ